MDSQFSRTEIIIGQEKQNLLKSKTVAVFGIGGVGGYVVESLSRAGIENLILVDNDTISISNINRQIIALHSTIGKYKVDVMKDRLLDINPNINVITYKTFIENNNSKEILSAHKIDYIVDAIDTVSSKLELIKFANELNIPIISSMGTGNKMDPSKLKITDIRKTSYDPLAKKIRKLVNDERINGKVMVVCSDEQGKVKIDKEIPSNSFVPATAGLVCASFVINDIVGDINV